MSRILPSIFLALALTACSSAPASTPPPPPSPLASTATGEGASPTPLPTEPPTETPTPTAPEWQKAEYRDINPNDINSLPQEMRDLWNNTVPNEVNALIEKNRPLALAGNTEAWLAGFPTEFSENMLKFDTAIKQYRRGFLFHQLGFDASTVEKMTDETVRWEVIKWGIENKQMVLITPVEDVQFLTGEGISDPKYNPFIISYTSKDGVYQDGILASSRLNENHPDFQMIWDSQHLDLAKYQIIVNGVRRTIPHWPDSGINGRSVIISPIPGIDSNVAVKQCVFYTNAYGSQYGVYPNIVLFQSQPGEKGDYYVQIDRFALVRFAEQDGWEYYFTRYGRAEKYTSIDPFLTALGGMISTNETGGIVNPGPMTSQAYPFQLGIHQPAIVSISPFSPDRSYSSLFPWEPIPAPATPTP